MGMSEQAWTVAMLLAAGLIAAAVVWVSRGNAWYAGTIVWALVAIVVANLTRRPDRVVAATAGAMAVMVIAAAIAVAGAGRAFGPGVRR